MRWIPTQRMLRLSLLYVLILLFFSLQGCASSKLKDARHEFYAGHPESAADILVQLDTYPSRDKLIYLMEKGVIFFQLGRYDESIKAFLSASNLIEKQEVISITRQVGSIVSTEWITEYKGEYGERLWVHTYLMMNYLIVYKYEDALVEAKKALKTLGKYSDSLEGAHFTRALIALCHDNLDEYNGAYIEYKKLAATLPDLHPVVKDLYRIGSRLGFYDEIEQYKPYISEKNLNELFKRPVTELVLFAGLGRSPIKIPEEIFFPPSIRFSFPRYKDQTENLGAATIVTQNDEQDSSVISTDLSKVLRASLKARAKTILAKETARVAAKEAMAQTVGDNSGQMAEVLVRSILFLTEEADTRAWETLPASLNLVRIPLLPGKHQITIAIINRNGGIIEKKTLPEFTISSGQRIYQAIRR